MAEYEMLWGNVRRWLNTDGDLRQAVTEQAHLIAVRARVFAPVRTGRYKASIKVTRARGWDGRLAANVVADVPYARFVEEGRRDIHGRGHHVLRRAAESL